MINRAVRNVLIIVVLIGIIGLLIFPPIYQNGISTNITYPAYTDNSIVIAPQGYVISNVSGPANATGFVYFSLTHDGVISGNWSSNNATILTIFPYTINKSTLRSELNNISDNITAYSDSGVFNNITLLPGKYFIITGANPNHDVRVTADTPIIITYVHVPK